MTGGAPRTRVVVLFGGRSAEHEVSCTTAASVLPNLDPERYQVVAIGVTREGAWVRAEAVEGMLARGPGDRAALVGRVEAVGSALEPSEAFSASSLAVAEVADRVVVLPLLHGPLGEDGTMQGLLELAGVPYVGAGVLGSAVAMDKALSKQLLAVAAIPQAKWLGRPSWELASPAALQSFTDEVATVLGFPAFVKPANLGSSVGVTKAHDAQEFPASVAEALAFDDWLVVEEAITGREIEFAVLGNETPEVSVGGEIVPGKEFYDYEDKYLSDAALPLIPAPISADLMAEGQRLALAAYRALRLEGMARVDFFLEESGPARGWLVNEANTIPGFTPISMYPKLWAASGLAYPQLLDRLIELAVARHARRSGKIGRGRLTP